MSKISIVVPVYNEEALIESTYTRLKKALEKPLAATGDTFELLFVCDGCRDESFPILQKIAAKDKTVKIVNFARNFGHQTAITAGMRFATGDAVLTIDADLQDPPELIPDMLKLWRDGADVVYGVHRRRPGESAFKKFTAHIFYRVLTGLSTIDIPPDSGDFRLFSRAVCNYMNALPERNRYIRGLMVWVGFKHVPFEFDRDERKAGETKYTLKKMLKLATDGVLAFSYAPIAMLRSIGLLFIILPFFAAIAFLIWHVHETVYLLTAIAMLFTGILLCGMWALGEYIARILDEVRARPQYTVKNLVNIDKP